MKIIPKGKCRRSYTMNGTIYIVRIRHWCARCQCELNIIPGILRNVIHTRPSLNSAVICIDSGGRRIIVVWVTAVFHSFHICTITKESLPARLDEKTRDTEAITRFPHGVLGDVAEVDWPLALPRARNGHFACLAISLCYCVVEECTQCGRQIFVQNCDRGNVVLTVEKINYNLV